MASGDVPDLRRPMPHHPNLERTMARQTITTNKDLAKWLNSKPTRITGLGPERKPVRGKMIPTVRFDESGSLVKAFTYRKTA